MTRAPDSLVEGRPPICRCTERGSPGLTVHPDSLPKEPPSQVPDRAERGPSVPSSSLQNRWEQTQIWQEVWLSGGVGRGRKVSGSTCKALGLEPQ